MNNLIKAAFFATLIGVIGISIGRIVFDISLLGQGVIGALLFAGAFRLAVYLQTTREIL